MENDRYQQNSKLFVIGLICLLISLSLFAFGLYILPYLLWNWSYNVPEFVFVWREWLKETYNFSDSGASWSMILIFIIPAIITGFISHLASNRIDNQIYGVEQEKSTSMPEIKKDIRESLGFGFKIFLLIILVLVAVALVQWLVAPTTPPPNKECLCS